MGFQVQSHSESGKFLDEFVTQRSLKEHYIRGIYQSSISAIVSFKFRRDEMKLFQKKGWV